MFARIVFGLIGALLGYLALRYANRVQEIVGRWDWAEKLFAGGTQSAIKLLGILAIIASFIYLTGTHEMFVKNIVQSLQGNGQSLTR